MHKNLREFQYLNDIKTLQGGFEGLVGLDELVLMSCRQGNLRQSAKCILVMRCRLCHGYKSMENALYAWAEV